LDAAVVGYAVLVAGIDEKGCFLFAVAFKHEFDVFAAPFGAFADVPHGGFDCACVFACFVDVAAALVVGAGLLGVDFEHGFTPV
jgi:hypothetical protein